MDKVCGSTMTNDVEVTNELCLIWYRQRLAISLNLWIMNL